MTILFHLNVYVLSVKKIRHPLLGSVKRYINGMPLRYETSILLERAYLELIPFNANALSISDCSKKQIR